MDHTADAFRSTLLFGILAELLRQPAHTDRLDENASWKRTCSIGDRSFLPSRGCRATVARAPFDCALSRTRPHACPTACRAEFGLTA
ncbi:hypothetical protein ABZ835_19235 [Streptomyces sp. NPDC047461]|uniref:hypothetical protein n=1 Tax=Streptomyces sp. NPDC047461 TaxID=3155619 RepID=UPI0034031AEA